MASIGFNSIASLVAQRALGRSAFDVAQTFERLSSGQRINRASDDAAGLSIVSSLIANNRVYAQGVRNGNDGISALNIADGALGELSSVLIRLRELATGAANGAFSRSQRLSSDQEAEALTKEYNRIISATEFNGLKLLDGSLGRLNIQLGYGTSSVVGFGIAGEIARNAGTGAFTTNGQSTALSGALAGDLRTADINGDGYSDLLAADSGVVEIFLGSQSGTLTAGTTVVLAGPTVIGLDLADFNGDGKLDLLTGDNSGGTVHVALGNGDGTFKSESTLSTFATSFNVAAADVNNDGKVDIIAGGGVSSIGGVLLGNGDGTFQSISTFTSQASINAVRTGDFNGDGNIDLIMTSSTNSSLHLGRGDGTFGAATTLTGFTNRSAAGDVNHDGILDLVARGTNTVNVQLGNGDGSFKSGTSFTATGSGTVVLQDFDNDGLLDVSAIGNGQIRLLIGNGDGTFAAQQSSATFSGTSSGTSGDFNGDGVLDMVEADSSGNLGFQLGNTRTFTGIQRLNLTTRTEALGSISVIDSILDRVAKERGAIGSTMNRLGAGLSNLESTRVNIASAAGRILDVDVAGESARLVRSQILQQTAAAVLAQANQSPNLALQLLRS